MEVFVDADFAGNWFAKDATKQDTARSRHGYIIMFMGCLILWKLQMQTEIALSATESEYTGLSYSLRDDIPIMGLLNEMVKHKFIDKRATPRVVCRVFQDNSGAIEMARIHKYRPRTKHLNVKLHRFRDCVDRGEITIHAIESKWQLADYLTKPLDGPTLKRLSTKVMGN